ncbi:MAG: iron donor protein CyaY [Rickettsiaceae bacterium]|nr:MAG: iron donor protein CyaY [Rickettsiaceae bacterium]
MDNTEFLKLSQQTLNYIVNIIEDRDIECLIDIDFDTETIHLMTKDGTFVINQHSAAQEIWLASPISGPYRFLYTAGSWYSRNNTHLYQILKEELNIEFSEYNI